MVERPETHYDVLDLDRDASEEDIRAAYRELAKTCHPDTHPNDTGAAEKFQRLTEARDVLVDPDRKRAYDQKLPQWSFPLRRPTPGCVWAFTHEVVSERSQGLIATEHQAFENGVAIVLEEGVLVVGYDGPASHLRNTLVSQKMLHHVLSALETIVGRSQKFRTILGTSWEDWEAVKAMDVVAAAPSRSATTAPTTETRTTGDPWEDLIQRINVAGAKLSSAPIARAKYMRAALRDMVELFDRVAVDDVSSEPHLKQLNRAIQRLGDTVDVPPTMIAAEIIRLRGL